MFGVTAEGVAILRGRDEIVECIAVEVGGLILVYCACKWLPMVAYPLARVWIVSGVFLACTQNEYRRRWASRRGWVVACVELGGVEMGLIHDLGRSSRKMKGK